MIRVGIIDIDRDSREDVNALLRAPSPINREMKMVYASGSGNLLKDFAPDILLLDGIGQPIGTIRQLKVSFPEMPIIMLSNVIKKDIVRGYFSSGAVSYLLKKDMRDYLRYTIAVTFSGGSFISPEICRNLVSSTFKVEERVELLTARELQIAKSLVLGWSYKMIAHNYNISINTVRVYIKRIYAKFNINSKGELISQLTA